MSLIDNTVFWLWRMIFSLWNTSGSNMNGSYFKVNQLGVDWTAISYQGLEYINSLNMPPSMIQTEPFLSTFKTSMKASANSSTLWRRKATKKYGPKPNNSRYPGDWTNVKIYAYVCVNTCFISILLTSKASAENIFSLKSYRNGVKVWPGQTVTNFIPVFW